MYVYYDVIDCTLYTYTLHRVNIYQTSVSFMKCRHSRALLGVYEYMSP